jgi:release factor glutamine methyltransferase
VQIAEALSWGQRVLAERGREEATLDASVLLQVVLNRGRSYLLAFSERELNPAEQARYTELISRRSAGEPVAYITGEREFWSLAFAVSRDTLIPRPETETLVEAVLALPLSSSAQLLDLGTGTGAIACALAYERPGWSICAVDRSPGALVVAETNLQRHGLTNVVLCQSDWFSALEARHFDVIVSNPPYIAASDPHLQQGDVRHEPRSALVSGVDGLDDVRLIAARAREHLRRSGWLVLEHGYDQGGRVADILTVAGYQNVEGRQDLSGQDRITLGQWPGGRQDD